MQWCLCWFLLGSLWRILARLVLDLLLPYLLVWFHVLFPDTADWVQDSSLLSNRTSRKVHMKFGACISDKIKIFPFFPLQARLSGDYDPSRHRAPPDPEFLNQHPMGVNGKELESLRAIVDDEKNYPITINLCSSRFRRRMERNSAECDGGAPGVTGTWATVSTLRCPRKGRRRRLGLRKYERYKFTFAPPCLTPLIGSLA